jgi:hypothetical protein
MAVLIAFPCFAQEKPATPIPPTATDDYKQPQATAKEETKAFDEVTLLRIQNGILRIQGAQKDAALAQTAIDAAQTQLQKDYDKFLEANKLNKDEWILDPTRMVLIKKPKQ